MNPALKLVLLVLVSAGIVTAVVYVVGFEATAEAVRKAGPLAFLAVGALAVALLMLQAWAWEALNRAIDHDMPYVTVLQGAVVGLAGNILTPSTYLGGEPVKVIYVGRRTGLPYQELAGTVVLAKYLEALSFILFFSVGVVVATLGFRSVLFYPPNVPFGVALLVLAGAALGLFVVLWVSLVQRWMPLSRLVALLARVHVARGFFERLGERTSQMEHQVSRVFCEEGPVAFKAFGFFVLTHLVIFLKPAVFFLLGTNSSRLLLGLGELSLIFVACQALLAFQLTPSGAGTLDAGLIGTFALVGLAEPQCMAYLLCLRFWDAVVVGVGSLLAARVGAGILAGAPRAAPGPGPDGPAPP